MTQTTQQTTQKSEAVKETGCCPWFDTQSLDGKKFVWSNKLFVRDHVLSFWHIPLNFDRVMRRVQGCIAAAGVETDNNLTLTNEKSAWGSDLYVAVKNEVPGTEMARLSGTYLARVFEGEYRQAPDFLEKMQQYVKEIGQTSDEWLFFYPYCPACAKAYGKNFVVIFAKISS